jgi:hypothetical protein
LQGILIPPARSFFADFIIFPHVSFVNPASFYPFGFLGKGSGGNHSLGPERLENHPVDDFQCRPGGSPGQEKEWFPPVT